MATKPPVNEHPRIERFLTSSLHKLLASQDFNKISKMKEKWTDDLFTPDDSSIYSGKTEFSKVTQKEIPKFLKGQSKSKFASQYSLTDRTKKYIWKRLSEVYKPGELNILKEPKEIKDDPDILTEDVDQGELGDCYFLSALSALAEVPKRLKVLFPGNSFTASGAYEAKVFLHGEPCSVVIDDYFPFIQNGESEKDLIPAFTRFNSRSKNLWPMIIEKVWAKLNLTYEDIIAGNSSEAFEILSPAPIDTYYHDVHHETLFDEIKSFDDKDYIVCTDITHTQNSNIDYLTKMGLITNHSYTIIDAAEISNPKGEKIRLLKIRNPWGSNEWIGDWSDKSPKWTPEIKRLLNYNDEDDGTFWMSYEDFLKFYTTTHVSMIHNDYNFNSQRFNYDKTLAFNLVKIEVPKNSSGYFIVNQKNSRIYKNTRGLEDFQNKYCSMMVFKEENQNFLYIGASCGRQNRLFVKCDELKKGTYYVAVSFPVHKDLHSEFSDLARNHSVTEENITYRVGIYSPIEKINVVDIIGKEESEKAAAFLKFVIYDLASKNPEIYYFEDEGEKTSWRSISFENEAGAYGYICYNNDSDGFIYEKMTFSEFYNLNMIPIMEDGNINSIDFETETGIEDPNERNAVRFLRSIANAKSEVTVINSVKYGDDVTPKNPFEIVIKIAPKSRCSILIEKLDEDAGVELDSQISICYPTHILLDSSKFPCKKTRIQYNKKPVEIYECIIEHNAGIVYMFKNKTNNLKINCQVTFTKMDNLILARRPEDFDQIEPKVDDYNSEKSNADEYIVKNPEKEVIISLEPGQTKIFELSSKNVFESFSYSSQLDYSINVSGREFKSK